MHGHLHLGSRKPLTRVLVGAASATTAIALSVLMPSVADAADDPFGCNIQANYPHQSDHNAGGINAGVTTSCAAPPVWIQQEAQLWEHRWWGWNKIGTPGSNEVDNKAYIETYANTDWCHNGMVVKVDGDGRLMGDDGHIYSVHTESKIVRINDCNTLGDFAVL